MADADGMGSRPYRLVYPEAVRERIRDLGKRAKQLGLAPQFAAALRAIEGRLQSDPVEFGEPLRDFPETGLQERMGGLQHVYVRYGVDTSKRLVYVVHCTATWPGSGP
jgi:hypothetical protein